MRGLGARAALALGLALFLAAPAAAGSAALARGVRVLNRDLPAVALLPTGELLFGGEFVQACWESDSLDAELLVYDLESRTCLPFEQFAAGNPDVSQDPLLPQLVSTSGRPANLKALTDGELAVAYFVAFPPPSGGGSPPPPPPPPSNRLPIADAGPNQVVGEGEQVTLDGASSRDPDGSITGYAWTQTTGPQVDITSPNGPAPGFDAPAVDQDSALTFRLTVTDNRGGKGTDTVTVTVMNETFTDVPHTHWAHGFIETLHASGITGGCGTNRFCPDATVTRAQMAVFLERGMRGSGYSPPPGQGVFGDVPAPYWASGWIEQLAGDGITAGCGGGNFCPEAAVTRAQMAVFLEKAMAWPSPASPAPGTGTMFADVPLGHWACAWVEQFARDGITGGCGGGNYCPESPVTRAQMAVFLVKAFGL